MQNIQRCAIFLSTVDDRNVMNKSLILQFISTHPFLNRSLSALDAPSAKQAYIVKFEFAITRHYIGKQDGLE